MNSRKLFEYCFGCSPDIFPRTVLITPVFSVRRFREHCQTTAAFKGRLYSGIIASKSGVNFSVVCCGMGGRLMGDAVLLLDVTPVAGIIFVGTCGGLKDCGIGDFIVCESAFSGEGFTRYRTRAFDMKEIFDTGELIPAAPGRTEDLKNFLSGRLSSGTILRSGSIFTIGSLTAESRENVVSIEEKGFKAIDMELSAVYHAARETGRKATGLVFVSDLPARKPVWEEMTAREKRIYDTGLKELVRLSVEFASYRARS